MAEIEWIETPLVDESSVLIDPPSTTRDIVNSFDATAYKNVYLTADVTGGTNPSLSVEIWLWNGTRYVRTGDDPVLEPGVANLARLDGGGYIAVVPTASGAPTTWDLNVGAQRQC